MAEELAEGLGLNEVRFIPSANPPHKDTPLVSAQQRAEMVQLAIQGHHAFTLDTSELQRQGDSYTIDTLISLRDELGQNVSMTLFMGSDAFTKFDTWHRWQEIIEHCHIALVQRPQLRGEQHRLSKTLETFLHNHYSENSDELQRTPSGIVTMRQVTALDISSTEIRYALKHQRSVHYLMPDNVIEYIERHHLYR